MWKAVVLAVCLLVAGVQPMDDPTYGVKLCGREFIRAVIFTCGGSRWRRSITSAGERLKVLHCHHYCPCDVSTITVSSGDYVCDFIKWLKHIHSLHSWLSIQISNVIIISSYDPCELTLCSWWSFCLYHLLLICDVVQLYIKAYLWIREL